MYIIFLGTQKKIHCEPKDEKSWNSKQDHAA